MPTLLPENTEECGMAYNGCCDSWGCDRGCRSTNWFVPHYSFIPKFYPQSHPRGLEPVPRSSCPGSFWNMTYCKIENTHKTNYHEGIYCASCMNYNNEATKNKNGKAINREKRIRGWWEKDDYGYIENTDCDFCNEVSTKLKLRLSHFTTNCKYNGIRENNLYFIAICNRCTKKNPKQVFKRFDTIEEYTVYALSKGKLIK